MLHELLLEHDQVGLPGVGTFVAEVAPATFADKGYIVNPPFRKLVFHPNCLEDELLVDFYADSNKLERSIADAYIKDFLSEMKKVLLDRKSLSLPDLGRLRATKSNNIFFIPCEDLDIYPEGFGLAPLSMKTHMEMDDEVAIDVRPRLYRNPAPEVKAAAGPEVMPEAVPEPEALPETEPAPEAGTVPESESLVESDAIPEEESAPESELESDANIAPEYEPVPYVAPGYEYDTETDDVPETEPGQKPQPVPLPFPEKSEAVVFKAGDYHEGPGFRWWIIPLILLGLAVVAFCVFVIIAQIDPEILYPILYSPEELRILYS